MGVFSPICRSGKFYVLYKRAGQRVLLNQVSIVQSRALPAFHNNFSTYISSLSAVSFVHLSYQILAGFK